MILSYFYLKCDKCGSQCEESGKDKRNSREVARKFGWKQVRLPDGNMTDLCPKCLGIHDSDNIDKPISDRIK